MSTKIEWAINKDGTKGEVWNFITGCTHASEGCVNCYAERMFRRWNPQGSFNVVNFHEDKLAIPLRARKPRTYFVNSVSDFFHPKVLVYPLGDIVKAAFSVMAATPQHTYIILTKRARHMEEVMKQVGEDFRSNTYMNRYDSRLTPMKVIESHGLLSALYTAQWPFPNVWMVVSAENQKWFDERTNNLKRVESVVRGVSIEPQIGPITLGDSVEWLDWVLIGGESGPRSRPANVEWFRNIISECKLAGVPVFFKQMGTVLAKEWGMKDYKGSNFDEFNRDLSDIQVREMPYLFRE